MLTKNPRPRAGGDIGWASKRLGAYCIEQSVRFNIALGWEATIKFARILDVDPWDIDPKLKVLAPKGETPRQEVAVEDQATLSGSGKPQTRTITIRYDGMPDHLYGFEADSDAFASFLKPGDIAVVDRALQPELGDDVIIEFASGGYAVGELLAQSAKRLSLQSYASGDTRETPMAEVAHYDVIVDVHKPKKNRARRIPRQKEAKSAVS